MCVCNVCMYILSVSACVHLCFMCLHSKHNGDQIESYHAKWDKIKSYHAKCKAVQSDCHGPHIQSLGKQTNKQTNDRDQYHLRTLFAAKHKDTIIPDHKNLQLCYWSFSERLSLTNTTNNLTEHILKETQRHTPHEFTVGETQSGKLCPPFRRSSCGSRRVSRGQGKPAFPQCWSAARPSPQTDCSRRSLRSLRDRPRPPAGWRVWCRDGWSFGNALRPTINA